MNVIIKPHKQPFNVNIVPASVDEMEPKRAYPPEREEKCGSFKLKLATINISHGLQNHCIFFG